MTEVRLEVPARLDGARADRAVAVLAGVSRSVARRLLEEGSALVGGQPARPSDPVRAGTVLEVELPEAAPGPTPDASVPFTVRYEDEVLLVVDKPAGVVVHHGAGHRGGTLVDGLLAAYPDLAGLADRRFGLVHRLDRDTSGLLLVARTAASFDALQQALRERRVHRRYLALVHGEPPAATGTIDAPIGRDRLRPTRMAVVRDGRAARTHYRKLATWPGVTLLSVDLETGRTHQIRVHLAAIDHPLVGDPVYGRTGPGDPGRPWLHAVELEFPHPVTGETQRAVAPLPDDLRRSLVTLGPPQTGTLPSWVDSEG